MNSHQLFWLAERSSVCIKNLAWEEFQMGPLRTDIDSASTCGPVLKISERCVQRRP